MRATLNKALTEADLKDFIDWIGSQQAFLPVQYDYLDRRECPLALYLKSRGHNGVRVNVNTFETNDVYGQIPPVLQHIVKDQPWTYEALLVRATAAHVDMVYGINNKAADA